MDIEDYMTKKEVAEYLGISTQTVSNWKRAGKLLPAATIQRVGQPTLLYLRSDVEQVSAVKLISLRDSPPLALGDDASVDYPPDWTDEVQPDSLGDEDLWQLSMLLR